MGSPIMNADEINLFSECLAGWLILVIAVYTVFGYIWFPKYFRQAVQEDRT